MAKQITSNSGSPAVANTTPKAQLLGLGSSGKDVETLQHALVALGLDPGTCDGQMGAKTVAAVKTFQKSQSLKVDGIVGPLTRAALLKPKAAAAAAKPADAVKLAGGQPPKPTQTEDVMKYAVSAKVVDGLEAASHDWTNVGFFADIRKTLASAKTLGDFTKIADAARGNTLTAEHADTIEAIGTASTQAVRDALRDAYADPKANGAKSLQVAANMAKTPEDRAAIGKVSTKLAQEGLVVATLPATLQGVSTLVATDLAAASHDWTAGGFYDDIRKILTEARTPIDFAKVAEAARGGSKTAVHAETIAAIGTAPTLAVRLALRDAYANPSAQSGTLLLNAALAAKKPEDTAAIAAVRAKLVAEGYIK